MKSTKRIFILILIILFSLSLTGCNTDSLGEYKKASDKTEQIKKGQTSGEIALSMDFNTESMTQEEIRELNYYKDLKGSFAAVYDKESKKFIYRNYLNMGGLGFDFDYYMNGSEAFIKLPVIGKYMKLNEIQELEKNKVDDDYTENIISKEALEAISKNWINLMNKDDVFKGKDIVLTTPDGEVKTTEYTIKLNDEQIKKLFTECMSIASKDESFKRFYSEVQKNAKVFEGKALDKMLSDMKENINDYTVESFSYIAYVDIDGYIVNERVEAALIVKSNEMPGLRGMKFNMDIKNWNINKSQSFSFPELTEENTVKFEDMKKNNTFIVEDLFSSDKK